MTFVRGLVPLLHRSRTYEGSRPKSDAQSTRSERLQGAKERPFRDGGANGSNPGSLTDVEEDALDDRECRGGRVAQQPRQQTHPPRCAKTTPKASCSSPRDAPAGSALL